ncbi:MAG: hypothetical protein ACT4OJ_08815 [Bacteroidota bacterium]
MEQIRERLKALAAGVGPVQTILATVDSVNEDELTCVLDEEGVKLYDVRLRPVINGNESVTLIPKVVSWVLATRIEEDSEWMVIAADEVEKYRIVVGNMLFEMAGGKFMVKSGDENLGKCIDDLIAEILLIYAPKNTAAITAIKNRFKLLLSGS